MCAFTPVYVLVRAPSASESPSRSARSCPFAAANTSADPNLSPDQARATFVDAGYQVDHLRIWDWLSPPVRTLQVHDLPRNRVLLVQVYPDIPDAQRGSERMVEGYSARTWIDNLALFEANADDYQRVMTAALARNLGMVRAESTGGSRTRRARAHALPR